MREFPAPLDPQNTVMFITDFQLGRRDWLPDQMRVAGTDVDELESSASLVAVGGDNIHWRDNPTPEDEEYNLWYEARKKSVPWIVTAGNHDFACFTAPYTNRNAEQWVQAQRQPGKDQAFSTPSLRVLTITPDEWSIPEGENTWGPMPIPQSTIEWLDTELANDPRPTWLMLHVPMRRQYPGHLSVEADLALEGVIARRSNVIGYMSGHRHANILTDSRHAIQISIPLPEGGQRRIAAINGPPCGGQVLGTTLDPWDSPLHGMLLSYSQGRVTCRWRRFSSRQWQSFEGSRTKVIEVDA